MRPSCHAHCDGVFVASIDGASSCSVPASFLLGPVPPHADSTRAGEGGHKAHEAPHSLQQLLPRRRGPAASKPPNNAGVEGSNPGFDTDGREYADQRIGASPSGPHTEAPDVCTRPHVLCTPLPSLFPLLLRRPFWWFSGKDGR